MKYLLIAFLFLTCSLHQSEPLNAGYAHMRDPAESGILLIEQVVIDYDRFLQAVKLVETGNRNNITGDNGTAYGVLQIRGICVKDVNRIYGTDFTHSDMWDTLIAERVFQLYLSHGIKLYKAKYQRLPTPIQLAAMWNGGAYKGYHYPMALTYGRQVQELM